MNRNNALKLVACIVICQLAGAIGSLFTMPSIPTWYAGLNKPSFQPPNWVFGPVWITLYTLMGISVYLVWREDPSLKRNRSAILIFAAQLAVNSIWSIVFFGFRGIGAAFAVVVLLWLLIAATMLIFAKVSRKAAIILVPYIAWVTLAAALNYSIMALNP